MKKITKKILTSAVLAVALLGTTAQASVESKTWPATDKAKKIVKDAIVIDFYAPPFGIGWNKDHQLHDYMDRARDAGITGASITLSPTYFTFAQHLAEHKKWVDTMNQTADKFLFVHSVEDIEKAHKEGKYAVIWNTQTSSMLDGDLSKVALMRAMGLASMQLVYNGTYRAGDGVISFLNGVDRGLTPWGKSLVDEIVKQGIVVDLSHTGRNTTKDITDYMMEKHKGVPVIYSHSLPAGLYAEEPNRTAKGCYRNITDEQAKRAAATGGVVSPTFTEWMMDGVWPEDITPQQAADMIDYYVKLIGVDHVGIATDDMFTLELVAAFAEANPDAYDDGGYMNDAFAKGAKGCGELAKILPAVTDELLKRGYSEEDLKKIYGGNMMRVYKQVWK